MWRHRRSFHSRSPPRSPSPSPHLPRSLTPPPPFPRSTAPQFEAAPSSEFPQQPSPQIPISLTPPPLDISMVDGSFCQMFLEYVSNDLCEVESACGKNMVSYEDVEMMKKKFAKLLLGEDMAGLGVRVCLPHVHGDGDLLRLLP